MALRDVNAVVTITTNAVKAIDDGKKLKQIYADINEQLNLMKSEGKVDTKEFKDMQKLAEDTKAKINEMLRGMELIDKVMGDISGHIGKDLNRALRETSKEFNKTSSATDEGKAKLEKLRDVVADLKRELSDRRGLTMSLKDAEAQLRNLNNASLDKLKQGLAAVREEAAKATDPAKQAQYQQYAKNYEAQIAIKEHGNISAAPATGSLKSEDRLRAEAERQRLVQAYQVASQSSDAAHQRWSANALKEIQQYNSALAALTETEKKDAQAKREQKAAEDALAEENKVIINILTDRKVTMKELTEAQKTLQTELEKEKGLNLSYDDNDRVRQLERDLKKVKEAMNDIANLDLEKTLADLDASNLQQMEEALKRLKENASQIKFWDTDKFEKTASDIDNLEKKIDELKARMEGIADIDFDNLENVSTEKLEAALKRLEAQEKKLAGTDEATARQMAENKTKIINQLNRNKQATLDVANAQRVAGERGKHSAQDMQRAYDTLKQHLTTLNTSQRKEISDTQRQMRQLKADIEKVTGAVSNQSSVWKSAVRNITAYVGVFGAFNLIKNKLTEVIRGSEELSDQMAKVRMVSGLAMEDIEGLTRSLAKLDTRTTLQELTELSYIGSKLGFGELGVGALEEFTKAANQVNVALKEDLGSEAMTALSKITENMGLIKKMGVEQAMLSTSSAMFKLFTTSTAAAGPIVEVTRRLAPMAQISGFATHEILALASASDALMQSEEVAGTAMSKFMMAMQNNHNVIEKTLGLTEGSISTMMKSGKSMEAFLTILDKMSGKNVTELHNVWKLLGSEGDRLIRVILAMANHTDLVRQHLDTSAKAFKEATAVTEEYNIQQETAMGYLERAENKWRNAFINPDSSLAVKEMTKAWYDFTKSITDSDLALRSIKVSIDVLLGLLRLLIVLLPGITFGMLAKGAAMLADKLNLAKIATEGFTLSWKKMDAATKSNWVGLLIGLLVQAIYSIKEFSSSMSDAEKEQKKLNDAIENMHEKTDDEIHALDRLKNQLDNTNISQEERNALLSKVKKDYDIYLNYLGIEIKTVDELAKHYDALTKVMRQRFAYQEREEYKRDVMGGEEGLRMKRRKAGSDLSRLGKEQGFDTDLELIQTYVKGGKSAEEIFGLMFPDVQADELAALKSRPKGPATYATPGAAAAASNDYNHSFSNFKQALQGYVKALKQESSKESEIDAAFAAEIGDFDYDKWLRTQVTGEFKIQPDKGPAAAANKADQEAKAALRKDMQDMQKDTEGVITKIEEWYRLQETAVNEARADGQITEDRAKEMVRALNIMKNESLATARRAVTTGQTEAWDEMKRSTLPKMMADSSELSQNLLNEIQEVDVKNLHDHLKKFNGDKSVYGLSIGSFFDQMNAKAAGNQRESARLRAAITNEVEKALKQYHFVELAQDKMRSDLEAMGFLTETYEQWAERMRQGITEKPDTQLPSGKTISDKAAYEQMGQKFVEKRDIAYRINIENEKEALEWIQQFATDAEGNLEDWVYAFPELLRWIDLIKTRNEALKQDALPIARQAQQDIDEAMPSIQKFYGNLMQYEGAYYDAIKKRDDLQNKRINSWWEQSSEKKELDDMKWDNQINQFQYGMGNGKGFLFDTGLTNDLANDPEIEQQRLLLEEKIRIFEETKKLREQDEVSEEVYQQRMREKQQQMINYAQAIYSNVQNRVDRMQKFLSPISNFAQQAGQKIGEMVAGVKDQSMTWNEIWKNMVLAMAESVIQMGAQYLQNLIMQKSINKAMEAEELAHTVVIVNAGIAAASAKTLSTLGWLGLAIIPVISALLMGLLSAALGSRKDANSNSSSANKVKLKSGMLTYDEGNVQTVVGDDGRVYRAREQRSLPSGVSMITEPIATTVNGQQALVGERGPEIVIGRKTTRAIQMNRPDLLRDLVRFDKGITTRKARTFDEGNLQDLASAIRPEDGSTTVTAGTDASAERQALIDRMDKSDALMAQVLYFLQNPVAPNINMYGRGGLHEKMQQANQFYKRYEDKR